jgi:hypothetical protein
MAIKDTTDPLYFNVLETLALIPPDGNFLVTFKVRRVIAASSKIFYVSSAQMCRPCMHYWMMEPGEGKFMPDLLRSLYPQSARVLLEKLSAWVGCGNVYLDTIEVAPDDVVCSQCEKRLKVTNRYEKARQKDIANGLPVLDHRP